MWKHEFGKEKRDGNVYKFLENLKLPDECIIIPDIGGNLVWTLQSLKLSEKQTLFTSLGNASMGCSLPMAIGASIARPGVPIVSINGDGGIMMNIQELETIRHLNIPITIIVINNCGHGIVRQFQDTHFCSRYIGTSGGDIYGSEEGINIANIASGFGIESYRVHANNCNIEFSNKPIFYDVKIDCDQKIFPKMEFGSTLENMAPKRPELLKFMLPYN
jgi:acetolactate synthase-1/2/3 large subunit